MKKFVLSILVISAFVFADGKGFDVVYRRSNDAQIQLAFTTDFTITEVVKDGVIYSMINGAGSVTTNDNGYAELPYHATAVQLKDDRNVGMKYSYDTFEDISLDHPLLPSRGVISRSQNPDEIPYKIEGESVKNEWYPGKITEMTEPFIMRDVRGTNIIVYPYQYNAVTKTLRVYRKLTVTLTENDTEPVNPLIVKPEKVAKEMSGMYKTIFLNYNETKALPIGGHGEILVIYTSSNGGLAALQPWIDWKRQKGFKVNLLEKTNGTDLYVTQDIKNAYLANTNILYAQIVGDFPNLKSQVVNSVTSTTGSQDPMLGCTVGTDQYIDVIVGRFSVSSEAELTNQINKSISYEKTPTLSATWYEKGIGIASNEGAGSGDDGEGDQAHSDIIINNKLLPFTYSSVNTAYQANNVTKSTILSYINDGRSLINYTGHGNYDCFQSIYGGYLYDTDVATLTNGTKLPFVVSVACLVGNIEYTSKPCFGESWLRKVNGGAVAGWFSTISQPWLPPMKGQDYFNDILKGGYDYSSQPGDGINVTEQRTTVGTICCNASNLMLTESPTDASTKDTQEAWTILGDVSLQLRTDPPKLLTVSNTSVTAGTSFTTNIKAAGVNFQNALVSLYQNGNTYAGYTDASGNITISQSLVDGAAKLTVTGFNTETKSLDITVGGGSTEPPSAPALASPSNGSSTYDLTPSFDWNDVSGATSYTIQVDNNSAFTSPEVSQTVTVSTYTPSSNMALGTYYWRVRATNTYGSSSYTSAWTLTIEEVQAATLPFYENFNASTSLPSGWEIIDNQGSGQVWQFGTFAGGISGADGNYAYLNSDGYGSGNTQNCDLVTPVINMTGASNVTLAFSHYFRSYSGSSGTLSYSINGGSSWTQIQQWTADTTNPVSFSQVISAVAGQSQVKFKWNYTGTWGYYWSVDGISITAVDPIDPPSATTLAAGSVTVSGALLNGTVNANGESTTVTFEYGITTGYGSSISATPGTVTGTTNTSVSATLSGLAESTTYNFRVKAVSAGGTVYGSNRTFTTEQSVQPVDPPTALAAQVTGADVSLSWTAPESGVEPDTFTDGFESYADFALTFANWTQIDGDGIATWGSNEADFTNENYTGAFIIFNPSAATPALTGAWAPRTGSKYAACFAAQTPPNNDWLISPQLNIGPGYNLSLYARSLNSTYGLDRFKVGVSTTGTAQGDFTIISAGSYLEAPTAWTNYSYDLSSYAGQAVYIAIVCVSNDSFVFMLDDVTVNNAKGEVVYAQDFENEDKLSYTREKFVGKDSPRADLDNQPKAARSTLSGYKVYRNGSAIATITNPATVTYNDTGLTNGSYSYYVTATYTDPVQESDPSNTANAEVSVSFVIDSYPWAEGFEGTTFVPDHWTLQSVSATTWTQTTGYTVGENTIVAEEGTKFAYVNYHSTDAQNEWLITPEFDLSAISSPELSFYFHGSYEWTVTNPNCMLKVMQRVDGGTWTEIWRATDNPNFNVEHTIYTWFGQSLTLTGYSKGVVQLAFVYTGTDGAKFAVDDILIQGGDLEDPRDFAVASANGVEVTLGWNFVEGATYYNVYRSTDPYGSFALVGSTESNSYVDLPPSNENMHFYYLTAANDAKTGQAKPVIPVPAEVPNSEIK